MVVATDDNMLRIVAGANGAGYLPASMLVEEFRIAYRGWEKIEIELENVSKQFRPNLGDGLNDDVKRAIAALKNLQR